MYKKCDQDNLHNNNKSSGYIWMQNMENKLKKQILRKIYGFEDQKNKQLKNMESYP